MATIAVHTDMFRPVAQGSARKTTGQLMLAQAKLAAVIYPSLMIVAFFGAIGAAYVNPDLLKPASTLNEQPSVTAPAEQVGEQAPLVAGREMPLSTGQIIPQRRIVVRHGQEHCIDQAAPDGRYLGKLCTPDPDGSKSAVIGARPTQRAVP